MEIIVLNIGSIHLVLHRQVLIQIIHTVKTKQQKRYSVYGDIYDHTYAFFTRGFLMYAYQ